MSAARRAIVAATCLVWLAWPGTALARPKTDIVVLRNGDRISCEIKKLDRGLLQVSTDDMGTIDVEWLKIASVTSTAWFEVETGAGIRYYGPLSTTTPGQVVVGVGEAIVALAMPDVIRITTIEAGFWNRLYGNIGAGGSYTQSSGVAQASVNFLLGARRPAFEWQTSFDGTLTVEEAQPNTGRFTAKTGYTRLLSNRWLVPGTVTVEQNQDLGFNLRTTVALGVGRTVVQSNRSRLRLGAALGANRELPVDGSPVTNVEIVLPLDYEFFTYDFPKTDLAVGVTAFPSLSDLGRFRLNSNFSLSREFFAKDFYIAATVYDDFDSRPPTEGASKNDVGLTFSLGYKW